MVDDGSETRIEDAARPVGDVEEGISRVQPHRIEIVGKFGALVESRPMLTVLIALTSGIDDDERIYGKGVDDSVVGQVQTRVVGKAERRNVERSVLSNVFRDDGVRQSGAVGVTPFNQFLKH